jgi:hypothetical protein
MGPGREAAAEQGGPLRHPDDAVAAASERCRLVAFLVIAMVGPGVAAPTDVGLQLGNSVVAIPRPIRANVRDVATVRLANADR